MPTATTKSRRRSRVSAPATSPWGNKCRAFEAAFAARFRSRHAIFVNSGSSANLLAWFALANAGLRAA
ncbi:MAG: hypothetical protein EXR04_00765 [Rhodospirillales bacterium]|nr:hypothetical protein [Rhodospirillales bacterium]